MTLALVIIALLLIAADVATTIAFRRRGHRETGGLFGFARDVEGRPRYLLSVVGRTAAIAICAWLAFAYPGAGEWFLAAICGLQLFVVGNNLIVLDVL